MAYAKLGEQGSSPWMIGIGLSWLVLTQSVLCMAIREVEGKSMRERLQQFLLFVFAVIGAGMTILTNIISTVLSSS